jgi:type VI secretion system secreted protein VgrG
VKFKFDESALQGGQASTWVRMMQPHGGDVEGFHFPLRKDTEVVIGFLDGDVDRPVIFGSVPNAVKPSPVTQSNATRNVVQTGGRNRLEFEDQSGSQWVHLSTPASSTHLFLGATGSEGDHNFVLETQGTGHLHTGGSWDVDVGGALTETVSGEVNETYEADTSQTVFGNKSHLVHGSQEETVMSGFTQTIMEYSRRTILGPYTQLHMGPHTHVHKGPHAHTHVGPLVHTHEGPHTHSHTGPLVHTHAGPLTRQRTGTTKEVLLGNVSREVTGNVEEKVTGNVVHTASGNVGWTIGGNVDITCQQWNVRTMGDASHSHSGNHTEQTFGEKHETFYGIKTQTCVVDRNSFVLGLKVDWTAGASSKWVGGVQSDDSPVKQTAAVIKHTLEAASLTMEFMSAVFNGIDLNLEAAFTTIG